MAQLRGDVSDRVIRKIADAADSDVLELPPLYDAIDPDALDAVVDGMADGEISFRYAGHDVTIDRDGSIRVDELRAGQSKMEPAVSGD